MTAKRLEAWCAANAASYRTFELHGGQVVLEVTTSDAQLWRTGFIKNPETNEAECRESKAEGLLRFLKHKYPSTEKRS